MAIPTSITFHQLPHSDALETDIRAQVRNLEKFFDRITSCRVVVEEPHRHQQQGRLFEVRVELRVPGDELIAARSPCDRSEHEDPHLAVRDAFLAVLHQLEHYLGRRRAHIKALGDRQTPRKIDA